MSIVPRSSLSRTELRLLGNNLGDVQRRSIPRRRITTAGAVNRSLMRLGEQIRLLHPRPLVKA